MRLVVSVSREMQTNQSSAPRCGGRPSCRNASLALVGRGFFLLAACAFRASAQVQPGYNCGVTRLPLVKDTVRRMCLRQCDSVEHRPRFDDWEVYCRETAAMDAWDEDCQAYLCCTFGCAIYGGDRAPCEQATGTDRYTLLAESRAQMYSSGITQEKRCLLTKCHSYCAKAVFDTCRETQFTDACRESQPELYGCDVDCDGASRTVPSPPFIAVLLSTFIVVRLAMASV